MAWQDELMAQVSTTIAIEYPKLQITMSPPPPHHLPMAPSQSGTPCLASSSTLTRPLAMFLSSFMSKKLVARPVLPTRPVRPILKQNW